MKKMFLFLFILGSYNVTTSQSSPYDGGYEDFAFDLCEDFAFDLADDIYEETGDGFYAGEAFQAAYNFCVALNAGYY